MAFIEVTRRKDAKSLLNGLNPTNVDEGARMLNERGLNKVCDPGRVADVSEPFKAFEDVSRSVGKWGTDQTKGSYRRALTARKRAHKLRVAEAHTELCDKLREKYDKAHAKPKDHERLDPWREGLVRETNEERLPNGLRVVDCSAKEAAERIREAGSTDLSLNRFYKNWKKERRENMDRHELNIQAICEARAWMLPGKC